MQFTKRDINKQNRNGEVSFYNVGDSSSQSSSSGVTLDQVRRNFVSIEFFKKLFQAHDSTDSENILNIDPNDTDSTITDLEFKFGSWSSYFISALGRNSSGGGGGGSVGVLNDLDDVDTTGAANGKVLTYQNGMWVPGTGGGSGSVSWADITDKPTTLSGYGITDAIPLAGSSYITGKLEPNTNNSIDLGSSSYRWRYVYGVNGSFSSSLTVGGTDVSLDGHTHSASDITSGTFAAARIPTGISITGNAATATTASKLSTTSKTAWGQTYWTSGGIPTNVSGDMTSVGSITADYFKLNNTASNPYLEFMHTYSGTDYTFYVQAYQGSLFLGSNSTSGIRILSNGNVLQTHTARGYYLIDSANNNYPIGHDNGENLWIGATATAATHHTGQTFISAGYNSSTGAGNPTIRICVPNSSNNNGTNYYALHSGNYSTYLDDRYVTLSTAQTITGAKTFSNTIYIRKEGYAGVAFTHASTSYPNRLFTISQRDSSDTWVTNLMIFSTDGCVGIGNSTPTQKLHVIGNILATGAVTALSDMRRKSPVSEVNTRIEDMAKLPIFYYKWKMGYDDDMHIGTSAQEVQKLFPELVIGKEDLSVNYPVLGTTLGILNSRKLTSHEKEIKALKKENKALKERIKALEDRV